MFFLQALWVAFLVACVGYLLVVANGVFRK